MDVQHRFCLQSRTGVPRTNPERTPSIAPPCREVRLWDPAVARHAPHKHPSRHSQSPHSAARGSSMSPAAFPKRAPLISPQRFGEPAGAPSALEAVSDVTVPSATASSGRSVACRVCVLYCGSSGGKWHWCGGPESVHHGHTALSSASRDWVDGRQEVD